MLQKFYAIILALGLQGTSVKEAYYLLEEGDASTTPPGISNDDVEALYEYLNTVIDDPTFEGCLHAPVERFIEGRITALQRGYACPPVVRATALAIPGDYKEDGSGGRRR